MNEIKVTMKISDITLYNTLISLLALLCIYIGFIRVSFLVIIFSTLCLIYFGPISIMYIYYGLTHKNYLIINDEGLIDNYSIFKYGKVSWKDIKDIYIFGIKNYTIYVKTYDDQKFISRVPFLLKIYFKIYSNKWEKNEPVSFQ